jgi:uncharacterized protein YqgV (UPF0045/DUF77 family)
MNQRIVMETAVYPLREREVAELVMEFVDALREEGLEVEAGPMSSLVTGEVGEVFAGVQRAYERLSAEHQVVLRLVVVNGRPENEG